jgi:hypothetical protein
MRIDVTVPRDKGGVLGRGPTLHVFARTYQRDTCELDVQRWSAPALAVAVLDRLRSLHNKITR